MVVTPAASEEVAIHPLLQEIFYLNSARPADLRLCAVRWNPLQRTLPIARDGLSRRLRVACRKRRDQRLVVAERGAAIRAAPEGALDAPHLRFQSLQRGDQLAVAAARDKGGVQAKVRVHRVGGRLS